MPIYTATAVAHALYNHSNTTSGASVSSYPSAAMASAINAWKAARWRAQSGSDAVDLRNAQGVESTVKIGVLLAGDGT
jgi:hypothetical protein